MRHLPLIYWGAMLTIAGILAYIAGAAVLVVGIAFSVGAIREAARALMVCSAAPTMAGLLLVCVDLIFLLPYKRRTERLIEPPFAPVASFTVALTAYNDEASIADAVMDFRAHPGVRRVIVVSNNSTDQTIARAAGAGAVVFNETRQGYGWCVYRCFTEALRFDDADPIVLCEGDRTFRAADLDKLAAYLPHAHIVNGTRIVEQLRAYRTQLSTGMYYGNFVAGKLLELRHFGQGTFTDVGTTYKMIRRDALEALMPHLDPDVNLEFNAHFLDRALTERIPLVECPVTFHPRVGESKGGNLNNRRAMRVGFRMIVGMSLGWRWVRQAKPGGAAPL
jgi:glycosyltransferase involved in cell wall biosynthesis